MYDCHGEVAREIVVEDDLEPVDGRVSKGKQHYYKGAGAPYRGHHLDAGEPVPYDGYTLIGPPEVFYMGPMVLMHCFVGKTGIFELRFQPQFSDFIGSCGSKELDAIPNSKEFERSSMEIIKAVNIWSDWGNHWAQYYLIVDYKCRRRKYRQGGEPKDLYALLDYMMQTNWNFIWDKNAIDDVSFNGFVSDVADIFHSADIRHKLGTVYAILHSLQRSLPDKYAEFVGYAGLTEQHVVFQAVSLLEKLGVDVSQLKKFKKDEFNQFVHVVFNFLIEGRNCGDCCWVGLGDEIRKQYRDQTKRQIFGKVSLL